VDIVTSLPHTEIGKVNKVKLKESILAATALMSAVDRPGG